MNAMESFNQSLFLQINADPSTHAWKIQLALILANKLIYLVPISLAAMWLWGGEHSRRAALRILMVIAAALCVNYAISLALPHARPFVLGLGHAFFPHAPTSSFPSNHTTIIAAMGMTLICSRGLAGWGWLTLLLALAVGWSRVYLGVHFPLDILGGLVLAPIALVLATPLWHRVGTPVTNSAQALYRRCFSPLISRGWVRG